MKNWNKSGHKDLLKKTDAELKENFTGSKVELVNHGNQVKYSEIFHNYMEPAIQC